MSPSTVKLFVVRRFNVKKAGGSNKNAPQWPEACFNILYYMQAEGQILGMPLHCPKN